MQTGIRIVFAASVLLFITSGWSQVFIIPSRPTHYFYTPMAKVNPANHLVVGLHELSFGLPAHLQIQASLMDNIGRTNIGVKLGLNENLAIGAGLAHSIMHIGPGSHGIASWNPSRVGAYCAWEVMDNASFEVALTPHAQFRDRTSIGCDMGLLSRMNPVWSVIWEIGSSIDLNEKSLYLNTDGGIRIHPMSIPFLNFDFGIDLEEFKVESGSRKSVTVYFDALFSIVAR
jgi:hypothetical protein